MSEPTGDPRELFGLALAQALRVVTALEPAQYASPTPCSEFDVAQLANHFLGAMIRVGDVFAGNPLADLETSSEVPADGFGPALESAGKAAVAAMSDELLGQMLELPFATLPGAVVVQIYTLESLLHTWDLAAATGQLDALDESFYAAMLPFAQQMLPAENRGGEMPFAAVVEVAESAPLSHKLVAFSGRNPHFVTT